MAARHIGEIAGNRLTQSSTIAARRCFSTSSHENLLLLLQQHCPWAEPLHAELTGGEHIEAALRQGRGAILWLGNFVFSALVEPYALSRAGFPLHHLARPEHGFSDSAFAQHYLNPIMIAAENRYLAERILLCNESPAALLTMQRRLRANQVIGVRAHHYARSVFEVPFMSGWLRVASGPVELAQLTAAPLLPTFTLRAADGGYEVRVGSPIPLLQGGDRQSTSRAAVEHYARLLEPVVLAHPGQWISWYRQARPCTPGELHQSHRVAGPLALSVGGAPELNIGES